MVRWICGVSLKDRKRSVDLYSLLGVQSVAEVVRQGRLRWWGMWNVRVGMIGCRPVEMWWWRGWDVRVEGGRLGMNVWRMIWRCLVYILNGQCSEICGEASYRKECLTLAEHERNGRFKNKWWWWWKKFVLMMGMYLLKIQTKGLYYKTTEVLFNKK